MSPELQRMIEEEKKAADVPESRLQAEIERERGEVVNSAQGSLRVTSDTPPDDAGKIISLAERYGSDYSFTRDHRDAYEAQAREDDQAQVLRDYPVVANFFRDPARAAVGADSVEYYAKMADAIGAPKVKGAATGPVDQVSDFGRSLATGVPSSLGSAISGIGDLWDAALQMNYEHGLGSETYGLRAIPIVRGLAEAEAEYWKANPEAAKTAEQVLPGGAMRAYGGEFKDIAEAWRPDDQGFEDHVAEGVGQIIATVAAAYASGGATLPTIGFMGMGADQQASNMRRVDVDPATRPGEVALGAAITGGTEAVRLGQIMRVLPPAARSRLAGSVISRIAGQGLEEGAQEITEAVLQNLVSMGYDEEAKLFEGALEQGGIASASAALFQTLVEVAIPGRARGNETQRHVERQTKLREALSESPVLQRRKQDVEAFINEASDGETVLLDDEGLTQLYQADDGFRMILTEELGLTEDDISRAMDGYDIEVPVAKLQTVSEGFEQLLNITRTEPEAPTPAEAEDEVRAAAAEIDMADIQARVEDEVHALDGHEKVALQIHDMLLQAGRSPSEAAGGGEFWGAAFRILEEEGVNGEEVFQQLGLQIVGSDQRSQTPVQEVDTLLEQGLTNLNSVLTLSEPAALILTKRAKKSGYGGNDLPGAAEWEAARAKGLDMSSEVREARARDMGFDTETVLYHGTDGKGKAFRNFNPNLEGRATSSTTEVGVIWMTGSPTTANNFASNAVMTRRSREIGAMNRVQLEISKMADRLMGRSADVTTGQMVMPLYVDRSNMVEVSRQPMDWEHSDALIKQAKSEGRDGLIFRQPMDDDGPGPVYAIFNPSKVRSVHAAFDPELSDSANLLAQQALLSMSPEQRLLRAEEQGYTIKAYRGGRIYQRQSEAPDSQLVGGGWFSDSPDTAGTYASAFPMSEPFTLEARLRMVNPLEVDAGGASFDSIPAAALEGRLDPAGLSGRNNLSSEAVSLLARAEGYDGVVFSNMRDDKFDQEGAAPATVYKVFNNANVRSANAAFDPEFSDQAGLLLQEGVFDPQVFLENEVMVDQIEGGGQFARRYGFKLGDESYMVQFLDRPGGAPAMSMEAYAAPHAERFGVALDLAAMSPQEQASLVERIHAILGDYSKVPVHFPAQTQDEQEAMRDIALEIDPDEKAYIDDAEGYGFTLAGVGGARAAGKSYVASQPTAGHPQGEELLLTDLRAFEGRAPQSGRPEAGNSLLEGTQALEAGVRQLRSELDPDHAGEALLDHYADQGYDALVNGGADVETILDAIREKLGDGQNRLFQKERASVQIPGALEDTPGAQILGDKDVIVRLTKAADKTSFFHESAHIFLELYGALESKNENVAARMDTIRKWLYVKPGEALTRDQHEKFAEAFEAYLMEGKAPNAELKSLFRTFRAWFTEVYRVLRGKLPNLTPEAREIFDRMLATEDEIAFAQGQYGFRLSKAMSGVMSEDQIAKYQGFARKAGDVARDKLFRKHMDAVKRRERRQYRNDRKRVEAEVRAEFEGLPVYRARAELTDDGVTIREGIDPDMVAPDYGFATGDALLKAMDAFPVLERAVARETKRRMDELYGDILTDGSAEAEAVEAVFNEPSVKALEAERDALAARAARDPIPLKNIRAHAERLINETPINQIITPGKYAIKARDLHKRAIRAAAREQWDDALRYTHQAMLQHELARRAYKARAEFETIRRVLKPYRPSRFPKKDSHKKMEPGFIRAISDLTSLPGDDNQFARMESLRTFQTKQADEGIPVALPDAVLADQPLPEFRRMTMDQLRDFRDSVRALARQGRANSSEEKAKFTEGVQALAEVIRKNYTGKTRRETRNPTLMEKTGHKLRELESLFLRYPFLVEALQGGKDGIVVETLEQGLRRQLTLRNQRRHEMSRQLVAILDKHGITQSELNKRIEAPAIEAGPVKFEQVIALALNMGTESNRNRLANDPSLGSMADIQALLDEQLDEHHWNAVQDIWNLLDTLWPEAKTVEQRVTGMAPKKVDASAVTTKHGTYAGGYYPLAYDRGFLSNKDLEQSDVKDLWKGAVNGMATHAATNKGFLQERQQAVSRPLNLSLDTIITHIDDVTNDIYMREETINISRVLRHPAFQGALAETHGKEYGKTLETVVKRVVRGTERAGDGIEKLFRTLRVNASVAILGLNVRTALLAPISYFQTVLPRYGPKVVLDGMASFYAKGFNGQKFITEKSAFMRERVDTLSREAHERLRNAKRQSTWNKAQGAGYWMMSFVEIWSTSGPTWMGVYNDALAKGKSESDAITNADRAVATTQGSGLEIDQSVMQGGHEWQRALTFMWGYVSGYYGVVRNDIAKEAGYRKAWPVVKHLIILNILASLMEAFLRIKPDDDDDDPYLVAAQEMYWRNLLGMVPGISLAANRYGGGDSPAISTGQDLFKSWRSWERVASDFAETGEVEGEVAYKAARQTARSIGVALGVPGTVQIDKVINTLVVDDDPTLYELAFSGPDDDN